LNPPRITPTTDVNDLTKSKCDVRVPAAETGAPPAAATAPAPTGPLLSAYEVVREENIRRNQKFLQEMGIPSLKDSLAAMMPSSHPIPQERKAKPPMEPTRTSKRTRAASSIDQSAVQTESAIVIEGWERSVMENMNPSTTEVETNIARLKEKYVGKKLVDTVCGRCERRVILDVLRNVYDSEYMYVLFTDHIDEQDRDGESTEVYQITTRTIKCINKFYRNIINKNL
jgi:hypothetical protein